jgi:hypothetical protein
MKTSKVALLTTLLTLAVSGSAFASHGNHPLQVVRSSRSPVTSAEDAVRQREQSKSSVARKHVESENIAEDAVRQRNM